MLRLSEYDRCADLTGRRRNLGVIDVNVTRYSIPTKLNRPYTGRGG